MDVLSLATQNLVSPPVLFFVLGLGAALLRSDLSIPDAVAKGLSLYLIMAIGFKGGAEMAHSDPVQMAGVLLAGVFLSATLPLIGFMMLQRLTAVGRTDAAAIAAHYGSISIVTFIAAMDVATSRGIDTGGYMVAVAAAMEAPAILTGLLLAGQAARNQGGDTQSSPMSMLREVFCNGSIILLIGAFFIGWSTGTDGMEMVAPFFVDIFRGVLCLFLLDMGLIAGRGLLEQRRVLKPGLISFGIYMPLISAAIGLAVSAILRLNPGDAAVLMTLCASASYIAVPAAMRLALPAARPALSLTLSLGVTFPLNLTVGIPLYFSAATAVLG